MPKHRKKDTGELTCWIGATTFAEAIRHASKSVGFTQEELASALGFVQTSSEPLQKVYQDLARPETGPRRLGTARRERYCYAVLALIAGTSYERTFVDAMVRLGVLKRYKGAEWFARMAADELKSAKKSGLEASEVILMFGQPPADIADQEIIVPARSRSSAVELGLKALGGAFAGGPAPAE